MNFTATVKQELISLPLEKTCCMTSELNALTACCGSLALLGGGRVQLHYATQSAGVLRRIFTLLKQRHGISAAPRLVRLNSFGGVRQYQLRLTAEDSRTLLRSMDPQRRESAGLRGVPVRMTRRICCRRAWIRGAFLGCGTVTDPARGYRAEFVLADASRAAHLVRLLELAGVPAARIVRRGSEVVYLRQGDALVTLLGLMGASRAVFHVENVRAAGSLSGSVNRATNCDHANLSKQLSAAQRQVEQITRISLACGLTALPRELEEMARLRLSNPDAGLRELGEMTSPPLTKSGVQQRLRRIAAFAQALDGTAPHNP
ncbi:MAG: DNA-binding protein WhiA [Clostridiales bacterium]|nr:DNA-binding protein WhiA [Clostridiales bacterium]